MIVVDGRSVYSELAEVAAVPHTALLLVDMQRDFLEPDGCFGRAGADLSMYPAMRPRLRALLESARGHGVFVLHLQMTSLPGVSESPAQIRFNRRLQTSVNATAETLRYCLAGSDGQMFVPECQPHPNEPVIPKWRSSGFAGTNLDLLLRSNGIESVVIAGCTTEGCVESTAREALFHDYHVVIAEDCVASDSPEQHEASLLLMRHRFDVVRSSDVMRAWSSEPTNSRTVPEPRTHAELGLADG